MYLVAIAWIYVVLMLALAEAAAPNGSLLGAAITLVFWGLVPMAITLYILGAPARQRARRRTDAAASAGIDPDGSGHPPAVAVERPVAAEREEA